MTDPTLIDRAAVLALCTTLHHDLTASALADAMDRLITAAQETGGDVILKNTASTWGPHLNQITAHGLSAQAETEEELVRNWISVARRFLGAADDPPPALVAARGAQLAAALQIMDDDTGTDRTRFDHALIVMSLCPVGSALHGRAHDLATLLQAEMAEIRKGAAA